MQKFILLLVTFCALALQSQVNQAKITVRNGDQILPGVSAAINVEQLTTRSLRFTVNDIQAFPQIYVPNKCNGVGGYTYLGYRFRAFLQASDSEGNYIASMSSPIKDGTTVYTSATQQFFPGETFYFDSPTYCPNIPDNGYVKYTWKIRQIAVMKNEYGQIISCEGAYPFAVSFLEREFDVQFNYNTKTPRVTTVKPLNTFCLNSPSETASVQFTTPQTGFSNYYWFLNGVQYHKSSANTSIPVTVKTGDVVGVRVKNNNTVDCNGISDLVSVTVPGVPKNLDITGLTTYCEGSQILLTPSATEVTGQQMKYDWAYDSNFTLPVESSKIDAQGRLNFIADTPGTKLYFYRARNVLDCLTPAKQISVTTTAAISNFTITNQSANFCDTQAISFTAGALNATNYYWYKDDQQAILLGTGANFTLDSSNWILGNNTIYVKATNTNCETVLTPVNFTVNKTPTSLSVAGNATNYCIGNPILITPTAIGNAGIIYEWSQNDTFTLPVNPSFIDSEGRLSYNAIAPGTFTYYVRAKSASGTCYSQSKEVKFVVSNLVSNVTVTPSNPSICFGANLQFKASAVDAISYIWSSDQLGVNVIGTSSVLDLSSTNYIVGSNTIYLKVNGSGGCNATPIPVPFTVNAVPANLQVTGTLSAYCTDTPVLITPTATYTGTDAIIYEWSTASNFATLLDGSKVDSQGRLSFTPTAPGTTVYFVRAKSTTGNCISNVVTFPISVYNSVKNIAVVNNNAIVCNGQEVSFQVGADFAESYMWYKDSAGNVPIGSSQNITLTPSQYYLGLNTIYARAVNSANCNSTLTPVNFTVNEAPTNLVITGANPTYCTGSPILISPSATGSNLVYQWSSNINFTTLLDSSLIDSSGNLNYTPNTTGTVIYYVRAYNGSCYSNVKTVTYNVNAGVSNLQVSNENATFCDNATISFTAGAENTTNYSWYTFANGTGLIYNGATFTPTSAQYVIGTNTIYVKASNDNGCSSALKEIKYTVNASPKNLIVTGNQTNYCIGSPILISPSALGSGLTFEWSRDSNFSNLLDATYVDTTGRLSYTPTTPAGEVFYVRAKSSTGTCFSDVKTITLTIHPNVTNLTVTNQDAIVCDGQTISFTAGATGGSQYFFYKDAAGTILLTNNQTLSLDPSKYTLGLNTIYAQAKGVGNCTSAIVPINFTVKQSPSNLTLTGTEPTYCVGTPIFVTPSATGSNLVYQWSSNINFTTLLDATKVDANGNLNYTPTSTETTKLYVRAFNGTCYSNVETFTFNVVPGVGTIQVSNNGGTFCEGSNFTFTAGATNANSYSYFKFSNGTGLLATGATYTPNSNDYTVNTTTTIYVQASNTSGCSTGLIPVTYTVTSKPTNLQVTGLQNNYCVGNPILISPSATAGTQILSYEWSTSPNFTTILGSSFVDANGNLSYIPSSQGTFIYYTRAKTQAGCVSESKTVSFIVSNLVTNISVTPITPIVCFGTDVTFTASANNATSYKWTTDNQGVNVIGNNSILNLDKTKYKIGTNKIFLFVQNGAGCNSTPTEVEFTVNEAPTNLEITGAQSSYCTGTPIIITPSALGTGITYEWSQSSNFTTLLGSDMVDSQGRLNFTPSVTGNVQLFVRAKNSSGCYTTAQNVTFTVNQGVGTIQVTNNGGTFCNTDAINFTAGALNATNYSWFKFSNGTGLLSTGATYSPSSTQYVIGSNTIYVQANSGNNCNTLLLPVNFTVNAVPTNLEITGNQPTYCIGNPILVTPSATGSGAITYEWSTTSNFVNLLGSSFVDANGNLSYVPSSGGTYTYFVRAKGIGNCYSSYKTVSFVVSTLVSNVTITPTNPVVCYGKNVTFTASANNATSYKWTSDALGVNIIGTSSVLTLDNSKYIIGNNIIYLSVSNDGGCNATPIPVPFTVNEVPTNLELTNHNSSYCTGSQILIKPKVLNDNGSIIYQWSTSSTFGTLLDSNFVDAQGNLSYIPTVTNTFTYYVRAFNGSCYSETKTVTFNVTQGVTNLQVSNNNAIFCQGKPLSFTAGANGATTFNWFKFENGSGLLYSGATYSPQSTDYELGENIVYLQAISSSGGCTSALYPVKFTINPTPTEIAVYGNTNYCRGQNILIQPSAIGDNLSFQWSTTSNFVNGNILGSAYVDPNGNLSYISNAVGSVTYYVRAFNGSCYSEAIPVTITVNIQPTNLAVAKLTNTSSTTYCQNGNVEQYLATGVNVTKFRWYNDAALTQEVISDYTTGTNNNTLNVNPALWSIGTHNVYIVGENTNGCLTDPAIINFTIIKGITAITPDVNNFTICQSQTKVVTLDNPNNFTVTWYTNSAGTQLLNNSYVSNNGNTVTITGNNFSIGNTTIYYKIQNAGGCSSELSPLQFTVLISPTNLVVTNNNKIICENQNISFEASGQNVSEYIWYQDFNSGLLVNPSLLSGTGNNQLTIPAGALQPGTYTYQVVAKNASGCNTNPINVSFTVKAVPGKTTITGKTSYCQNETIGFSLLNSTTTTFKWFTDSNTLIPLNNAYVLNNGAQISIPGTIYNGGTYTLYYYATNQFCTTKVESVTFTVKQSPTNLNTSGNRNNYCQGDLIDIVVGSQGGATDYQWFEDATASLQLNPTYITGNIHERLQTTAFSVGSHTVYVRAANQNGCTSDLLPITFTVNPKPIITLFATTNNTIIAGKPITFNVNATGYTQWKILFNGSQIVPVGGNGWNNGTISSYTLTNSATLNQEGEYTFIISNGTCEETKKFRIYVLPQIIITHNKLDNIKEDNGVTKLVLTQHDLITFTNNLNNSNYSDEWVYGDGFINTTTAGSHYYNVAGEFTLGLKITNKTTGDIFNYNYDYPVLVKKVDGEINVSTLSPPDTNYTIYPNPYKEFLGLKFTANAGDKMIIRIFSLSGLSVFNAEWTANGVSGDKKWYNPLISAPQGAYIVVVNNVTQKTIFNAKLLKN